jgi:RHS repeat-associated protein
LRKYLWLDDMPTAVLTNDVGTLQALPVHADHLNTPRAVMDLDNAMRWSWTDPSDAFGKEPAANNPLGLGAVSFNLRFAGQVYDRESGMHYNVNRDYVPGMGRYAQSDPIGLAGGINTYAYVGANPLSFSDPTGLITASNVAAPNPSNPGPQMSFAPWARQPQAESCEPASSSTLAFNDCVKERQACTSLCTRARTDPDMPNIFGSSFRACMKGCMPARCGGN